MNIETTEQKLKAAQKRYMLAVEALQGSHKGGEIDEFQSALKDMKILERACASEKSLEYALKIEWKPLWNTGASSPHIIASEYNVFLIYLVGEYDPAWDGTYVRVISTKSKAIQPLAFVEFEDCYAYKSSGINDEVWDGHPLWDKGLETYSAHTVENSSWISKEKKIQSVHSCYKDEHWEHTQHYMLLFHDSIFECIARNYKIHLYRDSFENVLHMACQKLL